MYCLYAETRVFQIYCQWSIMIVRLLSLNFFVFVIIKYMNEVAGVSLTSAGRMVGVHIGMCVIWLMVSARIADYVRKENILSTTQVSNVHS